nr:lactonase family protein [Armatimonadota bacterium]
VQKFYLGMGVHPTKQLLYVNAPMTAPATLLVYSYDSTGNLTFVSSVPNPGRAACWIAIDPTGSYLYTTNTLDDTITGYNITGNNATNPVMIGSAPFLLSQAKGRGTTYETAFDATGSFLFVNSPNNLGAVPDAVVANQFDPIPGPNGPGNTLHTLILNKSDGTLSEAPSSPVLLPVPGNANPEGVLAF